MEAELGALGLKCLFTLINGLRVSVTARGALVPVTIRFASVCHPLCIGYLTVTSPARRFIYLAPYMAAPSVRAPSARILR